MQQHIYTSASIFRLMIKLLIMYSALYRNYIEATGRSGRIALTRLLELARKNIENVTIIFYLNKFYNS